MDFFKTLDSHPLLKVFITQQHACKCSLKATVMELETPSFIDSSNYQTASSHLSNQLTVWPSGVTTGLPGDAPPIETGLPYLDGGIMIIIIKEIKKQEKCNG